jgi:hypothetical protein
MEWSMSRTTRSALAVARTALKVGQNALPDYSHRNSPRKFTQPLLFALLVLRQFFRTDYRGLIVRLEEWAELRRALKLKSVPHYSTLCYAERRLLKKTPPIESLMPSWWKRESGG